MERILTAIGAVIAACALSMALTALMRRVAPRLGLTDRPDGHRKLHLRPTPLGGGLAVFLTLVAVITVLTLVPNPFQESLQSRLAEKPFRLLAGLWIVGLGLVDDRVGLRGRHKLLGQIIAAAILVAGGLVIQRIGILGWQVELGIMAVPFTMFWLLGAVNALNLLDGIDGLATMVGVILTGTIAALALMAGRYEVAIVAMVFAAALVGFLRFNFPPATIFLGDAGSMLIGLIVGTLAIDGALKGPGTVLLAAPLALWTIPIFDSVTAIIRRKLTGRSIYTTDRGHLHHRLLDLLGSNRRVLAGVGVCCAITSVSALMSVFWSNDLIALSTCVALILIIIASGVFGWAELILVGKCIGWWLVPTLPNGASNGSRQTCITLQGTRQWTLLWDAFTESADKLGLDRIRLDVNLPAVREGGHALWERKKRFNPERCWSVKLPLVVGGSCVGRLTVTGQRNGGSACDDLQRLLELIEPFETQLARLAGATQPQPIESAPATAWRIEDVQYAAEPLLVGARPR